MKNQTKYSIVIIASILLILMPDPKVLANDNLVIYSARKEQLIKPLFDAFSKKTNIKIKYLTSKANELIERLKLEGKHTPADILLTVDAGNLWYATTQDILTPIKSSYLDKTIATHLKDPQNRWIGISVRARTIIYNSERISAAELSSYADLAKAKWRQQLCLRTAKKIYNKSLVASLIYHKGENATANIVKNWMANLATAPYSQDSQVIAAISSGQCDIGLINTYYFGQFVAKNPNTKIKLFWANQNTSGTHINISGAGIIKHSTNKKQAQQFIEWLVSAKAQNIYAKLNYEYPVNQSVKPNTIVKNWGEFKPDTMPLIQVGILQQQAVKLMQKANYY